MRVVRSLVTDWWVYVNAQGSSSGTLLIMAVKCGVAGILEGLAGDSGVNVNLRDRVGGSPPHLAAWVKDVAILRRLVQREDVGFGFEFGVLWRVVFTLSSCGPRYLDWRSGRRYCRLFALNRKIGGGKHKTREKIEGHTDNVRHLLSYFGEL